MTMLEALRLRTTAFKRLLKMMITFFSHRMSGSSAALERSPDCQRSLLGRSHRAVHVRRRLRAHRRAHHQVPF